MLRIETYRRIPVLPEVLTGLLPAALTDAVAHCGAGRVEELRLHAGRRASVTCEGKSYPLPVVFSAAEMDGLLKRMCAGSLYAYAESICRGYLTLPGGIRVGVCGSAAVEGGKIIGVDRITGLILRLPHAFFADVAPLLSRLRAPLAVGGLLLYAPPGVGKTTVLRSLARAAAAPACGMRTVAVDAREELATGLSGEELNLDILSGYPMPLGIEIAVRCLGAELVLCDEIGNRTEADAILSAANCGVPVVASAHAGTLRELLARPFLLSLHRARVFGGYVRLWRNGSGFRFDISDWEAAEEVCSG